MQIPPSLLNQVRWVIFDAVGTLITPHPPVADAYHEIAHLHGSRLSREEIKDRFHTSYQRLMRDTDLDHSTNEAREYLTWQELVQDVLMDVDDQQVCFEALWAHFSQPAAWRLMPGRSALLSHLKAQGLNLGVASNFDGRLRAIAKGIPELNLINHFWISSEVGWKKPDVRFYEAIISHSGVRPHEILFIGDESVNDVQAPCRLGMRATLASALE